MTRSRSQALVELALILPILMVMLLGMIDLGRSLVFGVSVQQGARESARVATAAALDPTVTDSIVVQRLIVASAPAIADCAAVLDTPQSCGGGTWQFSLTLRPRSGSTTYTSLASARSSAAAISGSRVEIVARGTVSMFAGFAIGALGLGLSQITVRGDAVMVVM
jgi:Flp pilus assembly protein TadG